MTSRVTKLFLQNCLAAATSSSGKKRANDGETRGKKLSAASSLKAQAAGSGNNKKSRSRRRSKSAGKFAVRFLEAAQQEKQAADKTRENLRKLKTRANDKSKRLMMKALEKRKSHGIVMRLDHETRIVFMTSY
ncbi:hypothetical protein PINS_up007028 [Pythium insidiosum]|nr:hypothetical protein PINS_up007028 [Pythium insidiosum]